VPSQSIGNYPYSALVPSVLRRAVTHYWPRKRALEPKLERKSLVLPEPPLMTFEQVKAAAERYEANRRAKEGV